MQNNIFEFGDCYLIQLLGTAMGTSAAVMWATLYYAYHEVHTIIPKNGQNLLYFKRFIDDIFGRGSIYGACEMGARAPHMSSSRKKSTAVHTLHNVRYGDR